MKAQFLLVAIAAVSAITIKNKSVEEESESAPISDEQVQQFKALSEKLGLEMSDDMMVDQSAEDVSNAIIGAALESGKTQEEIEAAMGGNWASKECG